ncbi:heme biosynthesis HemY N-terminal domain-containing protein [Azonexus sp.]|uniref:heme biosynthesis HemY N-terminal domain-containing protein n=1 Tax=Azonexus sp. TaxID=1872668 RepID=UPI0027B9F8EF|nr:heme biosynthesis HemY N-terminal domain-containing protein [Azonexus sp.]
MSGLFWVITLFGLAVAVAMGAHLNDGYVLIVVAPWRLEVSLNLLLLALLAAFLVLHFILRAFFFAVSMPRQAQEYRKRRQRERSGVVFQDAVRLLFEGRFGQALKRAGEAYDAGRAPGLAALIAARAAQRLGDPMRQQAWLDKAKQQDARNEAASLMLEAEMHNEERRFDEALAALARLQGKLGRHIAALRLELRARQGLGDWDGVLKLLRQLAKRDALPEETVRTLSTKAHRANIERCASERDTLVTYLRALPADERVPELALAASRALTAVGADAEAQKLIEGVLDSGDDEAWQCSLIGIYGRLTGADPMSRIARAEAWLRQRPTHAELLLALGRMCVRQRLWGKAQSYLEASLSLDETQEGHLELARLCDQLERTEEANRHYRAAVSQEFVGK